MHHYMTETPDLHSSQYSEPPTLTPRLWHVQPRVDAVCKLHTVNQAGYEEDIDLPLDVCVTVGRNPAMCDYAINSPFISNVHWKIHVIQSDDGGLIVSCEDVSTNGLVLNGDTIRRSAFILLDDDIVQLPNSQLFHCVHLFKGTPIPKAHLFDNPVSSSEERRVIRKFIVLPHCLGKGAFAEVHLGLWPRKHMQVACKTIKVKAKKLPRDGSRRAHQEDEFAKLLQERDILMGLSHPNIIRVFDAVPDYKNHFIHIFMQLCTGGDLFTYLLSHVETRARLGEGETQYLMFQLLKALSYLHEEHNIAHRDVKPENVLLYSPGYYPRILLADFGLARPRSLEETFTVVGTVSYLPPEAVMALDDPSRSTPYYGLPGDSWSAGVLMFMMLTGYHPFDRQLTTWESYRAMFGTDTFCQRYAPYYSFPDRKLSRADEDYVTKVRITTGLHHIHFEGSDWDTMYEAKRLVQGLLCEDPAYRYTIKRALNSRWIRKDLQGLEQAYQQRVIQAYA